MNHWMLNACVVSIFYWSSDVVVTYLFLLLFTDVYVGCLQRSDLGYFNGSCSGFIGIGDKIWGEIGWESYELMMQYFVLGEDWRQWNCLNHTYKYRSLNFSTGVFLLHFFFTNSAIFLQILYSNIVLVSTYCFLLPTQSCWLL